MESKTQNAIPAGRREQCYQTIYITIERSGFPLLAEGARFRVKVRAEPGAPALLMSTRNCQSVIGAKREAEALFGELRGKIKFRRRITPMFAQPCILRLSNEPIHYQHLPTFRDVPRRESARMYLESRLWPMASFCPECKSGERVGRQPKGGFYRCNACSLDFTIRTGTIFERSHIPLHKWLYAMYLLVTARKGISVAATRQRDRRHPEVAHGSCCNVSARRAARIDLDKLRGIVEVDECFIGGKEGNKHEHKKLKAGRGSVGKTAVLGMRERGGRTSRRSSRSTDIEHDPKRDLTHVEAGRTLYTDEHGAYSDLDGLFFRHDTVNHSAGEYVAAACTRTASRASGRS